MYEKHLLHLLGNYLLNYLLSSYHINLCDSGTDFISLLFEKFEDSREVLWQPHTVMVKVCICECYFFFYRLSFCYTYDSLTQASLLVSSYSILCMYPVYRLARSNTYYTKGKELWWMWNTHHGLLGLKLWSPAGGAVWEGYGTF